MDFVCYGGGWQEKLVGEAGEVLGGFGGEAGDAGGEPGLRGDGDLGTALDSFMLADEMLFGGHRVC